MVCRLATLSAVGAGALWLITMVPAPAAGAEAAVPRGLFRAILERIRRLKVPSAVPG